MPVEYLLQDLGNVRQDDSYFQNVDKLSLRNGEDYYYRNKMSLNRHLELKTRPRFTYQLLLMSCEV